MEMRSRWMVFGAAAIVLALAATGCGKMHSAFAPDAGGSQPAVAAVAAGAAAIAADAATAGPAEDDAAENEGQATPITGPTTITTPGDYRLANDFEVGSGDGIVITASNVRLWLGDHRLRGPGNKLGRAVVIKGARNVSVRGGRIERFGIAAVLVDASRCRVRDLAIQGGDETANPAAGNPPQIGIMLINSAMNRIAGNRMHDVNLGIFVRGGASYENQIQGNEVKGGANGLLAICYNPAPGVDPAGPHDDRVSLNVLSRFRTGISASAHSAENAFTLNTIRYFVSAYADANGTNVFERNRTERITP